MPSASLGQSRGSLPARFAPLVWYYIAAAAALVVGITLGVIMARPDVVGQAHDRILVAHIGMNVLGWVGLTVIGTVVLLWPTVLRTKARESSDAAAKRALPLLAAGVTLIGLACLLDLRVAVVFGILMYLVGFGQVFVEVYHHAQTVPPGKFRELEHRCGPRLVRDRVLGFGVLRCDGVDLGANRRPGRPARAALRRGICGTDSAGCAQLPAARGARRRAGGGQGIGPRIGSRRSLPDRRDQLRHPAVCAPGTDLVKVALAVLVLGTLASFLVLAVRAVVVARRVRLRPNAGAASLGSPRAVPPSIPRRSGMVTVAAGALVLAMSIGVALDPGAVGLAVPSSGGQGTATGHTTTVEMSMADYRFSPSTVEVPGRRQTGHPPHQRRHMLHDLVLANGVTSGSLAPGHSATVDVGVIGTDLDGWCSVAGHRQLGMVMKVVASVQRRLPPRTIRNTPPAQRPIGGQRLDIMARPGAGFRGARPALTGGIRRRCTR